MLPGWLVAASFTLVATKYYLNIFSRQQAWDVSRFAELTMRACPIVFAIPMAWVLFHDADAWPAAAALGCAWAALNNLACGRLCRRGARALQRAGRPLSPDMQRSLEYYTSWAFLMFVVAAFLLAGHLLIKERAGDVGWFFALLVALGLNGKMYVYNCTRSAPLMRNGLARFIHGYRALQLPVSPAPGGSRDTLSEANPAPATT
jgi:hypothetical protein